MLKYQGYTGQVEYDDEAGIFHGEVLDTRDVITFQGRSIKEIEQEFRSSIDDYLESCREQTAATYNRIAGYWNGPDFNRSNGIEQHQRALRFAATPGVALDIGCGSSGRFIELLLEQGFEVEGLDISTEMLRLAKERHPDVRFHQGDICTWEFPRKYDFITAWDSIWHVPLPQQPSVLRRICAGLNNDGVFIFTTGGVDSAGERTNPCLGEPLYHAAPGIANVLRTLEQAGCSLRHLEYDQHPESHLYIIAQRTGGIENG